MTETIDAAFSASSSTFEDRMREMIEDANLGYDKGFNLIVLGNSAAIRSVDWESFNPELFISGAITGSNHKFLNDVFESVCWDMDSRYSAMSMMGVETYSELIAPPVSYLIVFEDCEKLHQSPLIWNKLMRLIRHGYAAGFQVMAAPDA